MDKPAHLYLHIPFCNSLCSYCDFKRDLKSKYDIDSYIKKILNQIERECQSINFKTIYVGGGTPNCLINDNLETLLKKLNSILISGGEFTIECNPELINESQVEIFKKYNVNRISLGVQSVNNKILKLMGRKHTVTEIEESIELLKRRNITNISCDFIYGYNEMSLKDIKDDFEFINKNQINHVSFYSLELKENSLITKNNYQLNELKIEEQLKLIIKSFNKLNYHRYEVSSWAKHKKYQSLHNLGYWQTHDWKAIGYGAYGLENREYYAYIGTIDNFYKKSQIYSDKEYYFQILLMGLRLKDGLNLSINENKNAYDYFKLNLKNVIIDKKNHLKVNSLNTLDDILIEII